MRAAIYARVSSEEQVEGYSLDAQIRACKRYAKDNDWTVTNEFVEEGRSGRTDDINKRPQFKQMMEDAELGAFDVIVVHKLDRFSRNRRIAFEYFDKLSNWGLGFVSISENMDFSSAWGGLALTLLVGLAQFYSDNLSNEVKKGKAERKAQGLYNGLLPFGAKKGEDGIPLANPDTLAGLQMAFDLANEGKSDRDIAIALNNAGYRTAGNQGNRPFRKDTVRGILINRFYIGELPNDGGGWTSGKHESLVDEELFEAVQEARASNRKAPLCINTTANTYSLSGLMACGVCSSRIRIHKNDKGRIRVYCSGRAQGGQCTCKGTFLDIYEAQVEWYLDQFQIPADYQQRILEWYEGLDSGYADAGKMRANLNGRLQRNKDLYSWGDITEEEYCSQRDAVKRELSELPVENQDSVTLERLADYLGSVKQGWQEADQAQRNRLARVLFEEVKVQDRQVVAIKPVKEMEAFFQVSYECQRKSLAGDPDRSRVRQQLNWWPALNHQTLPVVPG